MKTLILLILCIITTGQVMADCAGSGIYAFPRTETIKQNSLILLTGYAGSEDIIASLNEKYPVYLESKGHKVKLNVKSTHKGMFQLTQAILEPNEKLIPGRTYQLIIDEVKSTTLTIWNPELNKNVPIAWKVESGMDNTIPNFVGQPEFTDTRIAFFGCGPEVYAVFKIQTEDESEVLVKTELVDIESGASNIYFLILNETDLLNVGHGMCSGAFDYKKEGRYKVRFSLMDICGNENNEWADFSTRWASSYGSKVDLIAPGVTDIVLTSVYVNYPAPKPFVYPNCTPMPSIANYPNKYQCFNGTSASAPHVTGVAALMYSRHNLLATPPAPNNLTTEDIEKIIQKTAKDVVGGPDIFNGHGLLDAGKAVKQIDYPKYYVKHSDINTAPTVTIDQSNSVVNVMTEINNIPAGTYVADLYKYEWNYQNDVLNSAGEEIIDWWPVLAGTYKGVSANSNITGAPFIDVTPSINVGGTTSSVDVVTYAWEIKYPQNNPSVQINEWIAGEAKNHNPNNLKYMYSIHVENESLLSVDKEALETEVVLYPNPTNESITVVFNQYLKDPKIEIFNLEGRLIKTINNNSSNKAIKVDVSSLSNGIYLLRLKDKERAVTNKFIKQ